jgi:hypothetical protein
MLQAIGPMLGNREVLVLPTYQRDGRVLYGSHDLDAVRLARNNGLNAAFLHKAEDREYLHEYSAGWVVEFAIALSANVAAVGLTPLVNYVIARARQAVDHGLHSGPAEDVPLRMTVAHFHHGADGAMDLEGLKIKGPAGAAAEVLRALVESDFQTKELPHEPAEEPSHRDELELPSESETDKGQDAE